MTNDTSEPQSTPPSVTLRQRAEKVFQSRLSSLPSLLEIPPLEKARATLHDLHVHQIELEMQNEELRRTQTDLQAMQSRYFDLYNLAPVGYCTLSETGLILETNLTATELLGMSRVTMLKQPISRFIVKEDQDIYYLHRKKLFKTKEPQTSELRMLKRDETVFWAYLTATVATHDDGSFVCRIVISDITVRKQAEMALRLKNYVFDASLAANSIADLNGIITETNDRFLRIWDYPNKNDVIGQPIKHFLNDASEAITIITALNGTGQWEGEYTAKRRDSSTFTAQCLATIIRDENGTLLGYQSSVIDITERKRAANFLRLIINNIPDFVFWKDRNSIYQGCNNVFAQAAGVGSPDSIVGKTDYDFGWKKEESDFFVTVDRRVMENNKAEYHIIEPQLQAGGKQTWVETCKVPLHDEQGQVIGILGTYMDITERIHAEAELLKLKKLESVGTLAGGIAHDFNNILMGLFGHISLAKSELPKDHPGFKSLEIAEKSMNRAMRLTKQLLTFAKGGEPVIEHVNLGSLVEEVARFDLSGSNVLLIHKFPANLWNADADKGQIQQVISNLTTNAREAMPNGGHLYITLENAEIQEETIPGLLPGKYIKATLRDEGTGIDPKCIDQIFDPYFTTKQTGSGLGLATSYSIITKHGGHIDVVSELGKGSSFTLYLPASKDQFQAPSKPADTKPSSLTPALKILVLDDEEYIRMVIPRWLKRLGCIVEAAVDGREAVDRFKQALKAGAPFDLLILDLTIPGSIGGKEVLNEILALDPGAKAIVSSGYAESAIMSNYTFYGFKGVLAKPYTEDQLQEVLLQVLQGTATPIS